VSYEGLGVAFALRGSEVVTAMNLLLVLVILLLVASLPTWPYSSAWGYYPSGGLGLVFIILIVLLLSRRTV
jgi:hypothetical protein